MNRILVLVQGGENRRLLMSWLAARYEVLPGADQILESPFDLGIVDGPMLDRCRRQIADRRQAEQPVLLPFLLVTSQPGTGTASGLLRETIDEVIRTPIEKVELQTRVEMLLNARRLSLALRKQAEDLSARLGRVMEDSPDEIMVFDAHTLRIVQANQSASRDLGFSPEEILSLTPLDLAPEITPEQLSALLEPLRTGERTQVVFEAMQRRKDGSRYPVEARVQISRTETPPVFVAVVHDISERRQAQSELEAARQRVFQAEVEKKNFYREVIRAVTHGKLHLVDAAGIPSEGRLVADVPLNDARDYSVARGQIRRAAHDAGLADQGVYDLLLVSGEAITNAIKHATQGRCAVFATEDRIIVRVSDRGTGIQVENLPDTILTPGFSTKVSLGMGYTLMLQFADRVWLATGPEGTILQIEKCLHATGMAEPPLIAAWKQL